MEEAHRALRPFERVIAFFGGLLLVGLVFQVGYFASGEESLFGFGAPEVCVSSSPFQLDHYQGHVRGPELPDGRRISVSEVDVCRTDPTTGERILSSIDQGAASLFGAGVLLLLWRMLRRGRHEGVFVDAFARRVSRLGLYVLLGAAAVNVVRTWAEWQLLKSLMPVGAHPGTWHVSFTPLVLGFGLITVGRLMAATVPMREELDATV
jgi:Protein of unknown function (DUF2975)